MQRDRVVLNNRPYPLRLVLDQGYWHDTGMHGARRRGAQARRGARESHGLQRRAQAPEARGPALPLLGRRAGPAGLGGDAERLPLHARLGRAADSDGLPAIERDYQPSRASSRGCRSTSRGACRTFPTIAARAALRAGALPSDARRSIRPGRSLATTAGRASRPTSSASTITTTTRTACARRYRAHDELPRLFRRERPGGRLLMLE